MTRVLFAWELGAGLGHARPLAGLARRMVERRPDIQPVFCFADPRLGRVALNSADWPVLPVPSTHNFAAAASRASSYIQVLSSAGFSNPEILTGALACWDDLYTVTGAEMVVVDHAPTAVAAARGRLPVVAIGTGFTLPPAQTPEYAALMSDVPAPTLHAELAQIEQGVHNQLAGSVIRYLTAAIALLNGYFTRVVNVLSATGLSQRINGWMLDYPAFITRGGLALIDEPLHGAPHGSVFDTTQNATAQHR